MRLSEIFGSEVLTEDGEHVGHVRDVRLVRDGPRLGSFGPTYRVRGLLVGRGSLGARLGLERDHIVSPWILRIVFGRRRPREIPWTDVVSVRDGTVRVRVRST
jgi:sporulation protein YlmC with PRC-barrel domain